MTSGLPATADLWRTDQLLALGLNSRAIARLVRSAELVRLRRGCYARGEWWRGLGSTARRRQLIFAHALGTLTTSAGGIVYSHVSGASLQGLQLWKVDERVHLTQEGRPSGISHGRGAARTEPRQIGAGQAPCRRFRAGSTLRNVEFARKDRAGR